MNQPRAQLLKRLDLLACPERVRMLPAAASLGALLVAGSIGIGAASTSALAQASLRADEASRSLAARQQQLGEARQREQEIAADVERMKGEREELNTRLVETAALIQQSEAQMSNIESRLGELEAQEKLLRGSLQQRHGTIAKLLGALQRMGRNPPPVMVTRREDALNMVRSAMLLAAAFPELRSKAFALVERLNELVRVMTDIRTEGDKLRAETERLNAARTKLASLMETKREALTQRQTELAEVRRAAADISRNVTNLSELIDKLDKTVAARTGLGDYNREAAAQAVAVAAAPATGGRDTIPMPSPAPDVGASPAAGKAPAIVDRKDLLPKERPAAEPPQKVAVATPPKISTSPQVVEIAPLRGTIAAGNLGRLKPAVPFHLAKARLPLPAQGKRVLSFGERTQYGGTSKGMVLATRHGAQVTAPSDGWVVYAGAFRTYGQLLIINAGAGYHILLAGLSQIDVQIGQFVLAAEPVGTMTQAANAAGTKDSTPVLYVEFRKDGQPVDPDPWWAQGQQKVQG